jgi:hypothetical protein
MPNLDLRDPHNRASFDLLAHFRVLSVMLYPNDAKARERVMSSVRAEAVGGPQRTRALTDSEAKIAQEFGASRGGEAGFMMMALIQLNAHGLKPSLGKAVDLIRFELPLFGIEEELAWRAELSHQHLPRHVGKLRKIYQQFGSVAHLWAVLVHEQQWDQWRLSQGQNELADLLPSTVGKLHRFLAYAEQIWSLYSELPIRRGSSPDKANIPERWTFTVPIGFNGLPHLVPLPIPEDRLHRITGQ